MNFARPAVYTVAAAAPFLKLSESAKTLQMLMSTRIENECETHMQQRKDATCFILLKSFI